MPKKTEEITEEAQKVAPEAEAPKVEIMTKTALETEAETPVELVTVYIPEKGKYEVSEEVKNGIKTKYTQVSINGVVTKIPAGVPFEVSKDVAFILGQA